MKLSKRIQCQHDREKSISGWSFPKSSGGLKPCLAFSVNNVCETFATPFNSPQGKNGKSINDGQMFILRPPCCCLTDEIWLLPANKKLIKMIVQVEDIKDDRIHARSASRSLRTSSAALFAASQGKRRAATSWRTPSCQNHRLQSKSEHNSKAEEIIC